KLFHYLVGPGRKLHREVDALIRGERPVNITLYGDFHNVARVVVRSGSVDRAQKTNVDGVARRGAVEPAAGVRLDDALNRVVLAGADGVLTGDGVADALADGLLEGAAKVDDHGEIDQEKGHGEQRNGDEAGFNKFSALLTSLSDFRDRFHG